MFNINKESKVNALIPDNSDTGLVSSIKVLKNGEVKAISVDVNITHPYVGDLAVSLVGPNGETVHLHQRKGGNSDNLVKTYEGDQLKAFHGSNTNGTWKLICKDFAPRDSGTLNHWSINMKAESTSKTQNDVFTMNKKSNKLRSAQHCRFNGKVSSLKVFVDIEHPNEKDLVINLISPSGKSVTLHNKDGRGRFEATTFKGSTMSDFKGQNCNGTWNLEVNDHGDKNSGGQLRKWKMFLEYEPTDNLSNLDGVSNKVESALNDAGINSYSGLATTSAKALGKIFNKAKGDFSSVDIDKLRANATQALETYVP